MMETKFLDYEYAVYVRDGQDITTEQMIQDICIFRQKFNKNKEGKDATKVTKELELGYFVDIQKARNIGVQNLAETRQIVDEVGDEKDSEAESTDSESVVGRIHKNERRKLETLNVYRAYKMMKQLLKGISDAERDSIGRHLVTTHVVDIHKKLMNDIPEFDGTVPGYTPGEFSTKFRGIELDDGELLPYHQFTTTAEVQKALDDLFLHYNRAIKEIQQMKDTKERIKAVFKCAAKVVFGLGLIHPFLDGNGRTSRLLCYYCLSLISPFPTPVYNVYSPSTRKEFGDSLMEARGGGNAGEETLENLMRKVRQAKPSKFCAILIEANWYMWKKLLSDLKIPM